MNDSPNQGTGGLEPETQPTGSAAGFFRVPWITYAVIAVCGAIYAYLNLATESSSYKQVAGILMPSEIRIWSGAYWGLLTSAFVHLAFWHILFNMWWTKDFGGLLEPTLGRVKYLLFIASAAVVSSGAQLAVSDQTGIGFSGVVYAMFGYTLAARHVEPRYQQIVNRQTIQWLLGWLVLCIVLSVANVWQVANGAHVAGFLFGYCVGNAFAARVWVVASRIGLALLLGLAVLSAVYMPWSQAWKMRGPIARLVALADAAARGDREAQYLQGIVLGQRDGMKPEAVSWLRKSAEQGYVPAMNALAWVLATSREDRLRDGAEAVKWAERACRQDTWKTAAYLDTLAAAYAEAGKWEEAVATQKLALSKLTGGAAKERPSFESRLQQYLKQEQARE
jgi:membrane associated rhomboid family serine protease